jgi:adenine deaminase
MDGAFMKLSADLLIKDGLLVDPVRETAVKTDVAIKDGRILSYTDMPSREVVDGSGCFVSCGFIESHLHVEGLHLLPEHYARAFLSHGTTTVVTDLHEVANAGGLAGVRWYLSLMDGVPLDLLVMAPSCVPSSRYELGAARLGVRELKSLRASRRVIGLGEVMDMEGVMGRRGDVLRKIALFEGKPVDGHAPGLIGDDLDLYMSVGIHSDHETTQEDEGLEKLRRGMHLFLREGSVAKDLRNLQPLISPKNLGRLSLCTDDLSFRDLYEQGHLDCIVSRLVRSHVPLFHALRLVTTNPALYFSLNDRNAPAPGRKADLVVFDRPEDMRVRVTVKDGKIVYREGEEVAPPPARLDVPVSMRVAHFSKEGLRKKAKGSRIRVMGVKEGEILIDDMSAEARTENGYLAADTDRDIALAYIFDRYRYEETYGFGFVKGFGLKSGALGTTYAHDSHNLIIVGDNMDDIYRVFEVLKELGGGMAASHNGATACIPMPYFGILSPLDARTFLDEEAELDGLVREMGVTLRNPFFQMSFLSLPVIPHLRLTTKGLFHVPTLRYVEANHD